MYVARFTAGQLSVLQYLSVGENYLSFLPEVRELAAGGVQKHRKLQPDSFSGDWVIGGPWVTLRERQPKLTRPALWACSLLQSSGAWWIKMAWNNFYLAQIMSIENCPLSQIPTEIVSGGPSLVIQVVIIYLKHLLKLYWSFSVFESARALQNHVKTQSCQKKLENASQKSTKFCWKVKEEEELWEEAAFEVVAVTVSFGLFWLKVNAHKI